MKTMVETADPEVGWLPRKDVPPGTLVEVRGWPNEVAVVAYDVIVSLSRPNNTWLNPETWVRRLPTGTTVTLVQEEEEEEEEC